MRLLSYWVLPIISGVVWLGMLLAMLLYWIIHTDSEIYPSMSEGQTIAYISDVGAEQLYPLFVAGCAVTAVFLDLAFLSDRWLRHRGRLVPNVTITEKVLMVLNIVSALVGTVGLICLAIFDTVNYSDLHRLFLLLFILGYLLSAIFICWEFQRLGIKHRQHRILRISFWVKLVFILVEAALAIAFGVTMFQASSNVAAVLEWVVALIFSFYVFSFVIDLYPAVYTKAPGARFPKPGMPAATGAEPGTFTDGGSSDSPREMEEGRQDQSVVPGREYPQYMDRQPGRNF